MVRTRTVSKLVYLGQKGSWYNLVAASRIILFAFASQFVLELDGRVTHFLALEFLPVLGTIRFAYRSNSLVTDGSDKLETRSEVKFTLIMICYIG